MSLFGDKQESYLGVDIGAHGIKLVELRKNKNRPQVWTYGVVEKNLDIHIGQVQEKHVEDLIKEKTGVHRKTKKVDPNAELKQMLREDSRIDEYAELLKKLLKETKTQTRRATSSLPVSHVFHTIINLPKTSPKNIDEIVQVEIGKLLPRPIEDMQIVYQEVPSEHEEKEKFTKLLVTAAPKELVAFYTAIFQKAGLQLQELETEAFALSRSLVGRDHSVSMIIDIGAERTNFFIVDNGLPVTHRSIQIGGNVIDEWLARSLGMQVEQVSRAKKDLSELINGELVTEPFEKLLAPIAKEVQYNFDVYLKQSGNEGKRPEKIILTGGASLFPPIAQYLQGLFPMRVFIGDPWARTIYQNGLKGILDENGPRMAVSIGLALRNFS